MHGPIVSRLGAALLVFFAAACGPSGGGAGQASCWEDAGMNRPATLPPTGAHWSGANAALADAAACGDAAGIKRAIANGAAVDAIGQREMPMILWPVLAENIDGFRLLLEEGADPAIRIDRGKTKPGTANTPLDRDSLALGLLAEGPDLAFLDLALVHGLSPDAVAGAGEPLVWRAALNGNWEAVQRLIEAGGDVDIADNANAAGDERYTLLAYYSAGAFDKALWLLENGAKADWPVTREREDGGTVKAFPILENIFYYEVDAAAFPALAAAQGKAQRHVLDRGHSRPPRPRRYAD